MSGDGNNQYFVCYNGYEYIYNNGTVTKFRNLGVTLAKRSLSLSVSKDGTYQLLTAENSVYVSSGGPFERVLSFGSNQGVVSSSGKYMAIVPYYRSSYIYTSNDYGKTWQQTDSAGNNYWFTIAMSLI